MGEHEVSHQESSTTRRCRSNVRGRGRGRTQTFVTQEAFVTEMGKLQEALQALKAHQEKSVSEGKEKSGSKEGT